MSELARVHALLRLGRDQEAAQAAEEALAADPDDVDLLLALADAQAGFDPGAAVSAAKRAVERGPQDPDALRVLARCHWREGSLNLALEAVDAMMAIAPTMPEAHSYRAGILLQNATQHGRPHKKTLAKAAESADRAVELAPNFAAAHYLRGQVALALKDRVTAERSARRVLAIDPEDSRGHELLGSIAEARGDVRTAGDHYLAAGRADPSSGAAERLASLSTPFKVGAGIALWLTYRVVVTLARNGQGIAAGVIAVVAVIVVLAALRWRRQQVDAALSEDARTARETARRSRRRWGR